MSKSIFAKYIITFVIIIIVTFSMMMSIIVALTNNYSASMQQEVAKSAAKSAYSPCFRFGKGPWTSILSRCRTEYAVFSFLFYEPQQQQESSSNGMSFLRR